MLLDLLSTERAVSPASVAALSGDDWADAGRLAQRERLGPLLHRRLTHERSGLPLPEVVLDGFTADYRHWTFRSLKIQRQLLRARQILAGEGIPSLALKGAYLAFHAYPEPALRPLRDLDLLVPADQALDAHRALASSGYAREGEYKGGAVAWKAAYRHLPALRAPVDNVLIELHTSISAGGPSVEGAGGTEGLWQRRVTREVAGREVEYLGQTDTLLHLIHHSLFEHRLNNGPLVLADIHYLVGQARSTGMSFGAGPRTPAGREAAVFSSRCRRCSSGHSRSPTPAPPRTGRTTSGRWRAGAPP